MKKWDQIHTRLLSNPHLTQRAVATQLGVSAGYVHAVRETMYEAGELTRARQRKTNRAVGVYTRSLDDLISDRRKFRTLLIDPPWPYGNQGTRASTSEHYQSMSLNALKALPVPELAERDSHLHLWTTNGFLAEAIQLMAAWQFTYKSMLVWVKPQMGIGNYWRVSHELLLFGLRGDCPFLSHRHKSWLLCGRGKHSAKPEEVRRRIEEVSPPAYLELFGRNRVDHWTVWGDQLESTLFNDGEALE